MPEGPSIVILKEAVASFAGKKILEATGNAKIDMSPLQGRKVTAFKSWGKHFLICLPGMTLRIHFLLFGSYSINEQTKPKPRLALRFAKGALYFYTCSVRLLDGDPEEIYDWRGDVMSDQWDPALARRRLKAMPDLLVCDALLDQNIFAGVGNIIKNEVLFRTRIHPESRIGKLPPRKLGELIREARNYSFDFLKWKKAFELRKHWLVHTKKTCPDGTPVTRVPKMGKTARRTFYCASCQVLYE
ncbi:MAG: endonuclease [Bacteroidota bacterium]|nr:endonuclease [Bacteroidota bacterium]MDP4218015.1 endonuclease [Bacteroidota bacterium]MDP4244466.1 endonuclease [Bacteroidota bacterium]MDP4254801.1 endonuclease [Bacteroidota bacterium]MDP4258194.1 endonuclease [Bacteroidota bacterium]